jgi:DNA-binding response OmpR family regulator
MMTPGEPGTGSAVNAVLLVEDDDSIADPLSEGLAYAGFQVRRVRTGQEALDEPDADLILLDLGLPDVDGGEVCRRLRSRSGAPIIVVTARGDELDRVMLLELGADDYVVKPFGFRELVARIRAVLRRVGVEQAGQAVAQTIGALSIDRRGRRVFLAGRELELTTKEFDLLAFLADEPGRVRRREQIIAAVWDEHWWGWPASNTTTATGCGSHIYSAVNNRPHRRAAGASAPTLWRHCSRRRTGIPSPTPSSVVRPP